MTAPQRVTPWWRGKAAMGGIAVGIVAVLVVAALAYFSSRSNKAIDIDSVAVLPLISNSSDQNTQFLSDGITDSLIDSLSQIPHLKVMSRSSVFHYKGREIDPQAFGRELKVKAVLTGQLEQRGDSLLLSTELLNVSDNSHIWGDRYDRRVADILPLQQELARTISGKLRTKLSTQEKERVEKQGTSNLEAYQLYLRGRYYQDKSTFDDSKKALVFFQQAIEKDPNYASAYAGMADVYAVWGVPRDDASQKASAMAVKAMEIDNALAEPHVSLGLIAIGQWNWRGAEKEFRKAVELNSNLAIAHQFYGWYLNVEGKWDEALAEFTLALERDPISLIPNLSLAHLYYSQRDYERSIQQYLKALELFPNNADAHYGLGDDYAALKMYDRSVEEYERALTLDGKADRVARIEKAHAAEGWKGVLKERIEALKNDSNREDYSPGGVALAYAGLGDKEQAFEWLEKAYQQHRDIMFIKVDPAYDPLRSDPRYADLLKRMGLPQ